MPSVDHHPRTLDGVAGRADILLDGSAAARPAFADAFVKVHGNLQAIFDVSGERSRDHAEKER